MNRFLSKIAGFGAAAAVLLLASGCNTDAHLLSTPYLEKDFQISPEQMSQYFYDVDRYEEVTFPFFAFFEMPPVNELKYGCYYGAPEEVGYSAWNLCPFFLLPIPLCPCKTMTWRRGCYRFKTQVAYPMLFGFKPHIWYWDVEWLPPDLNPDVIQVVAFDE